MLEKGSEININAIMVRYQGEGDNPGRGILDKWGYIESAHLNETRGTGPGDENPPGGSLARVSKWERSSKGVKEKGY